jgi:endonuclease/exonuclease/phosphatase family metal-dependent hydrolase
MSYNVRQFPDGGRGSGTDVEWLACVIASSNADLVAVQEFKNQRQAKAALDRLLARLDALTSGRWVATFDACPGALHVGVLYDGSRVKAESIDTFASLNPHETACKDQLRPGFGGYFRFPGGFDVHVISVHLKSSATTRGLDLRRRSLSRLNDVVVQAQKAHGDFDLVLAGDFNSMGCRKCSPELDSAGEIAALIPASPGCTHYFQGEGTLLDHFAVTRSTRELTLDSFARVGGYCGELSCKPLAQGEQLTSYRELSDHCPIVLDFVDRDLD